MPGWRNLGSEISIMHYVRTFFQNTEGIISPHQRFLHQDIKHTEIDKIISPFRLHVYIFCSKQWTNGQSPCIRRYISPVLQSWKVNKGGSLPHVLTPHVLNMHKSNERTEWFPWMHMFQNLNIGKIGKQQFACAVGVAILKFR